MQAILRAFKTINRTTNLKPNTPLPTLLIVDDDPLIRDSLRFALEDEFDIQLAEDRPQAIRLVRSMDRPPQLALVDLGLPPTPHRPEEGFRLITELLAHSPNIKVIALSGQNEVTHARHARALGAIEFIAKPCSPEALNGQLHNALRIQRSEQVTTTTEDSLSGIIGESPLIRALREQIKLYAATPYPVLVEGESGTGKELVAAALSQLRANNQEAPYIVFNCAAISSNLLEAALFGHVKGAYTGALATQAGFFEVAGNGTIFLDEIGELPLQLQVKLLRVLENGEFQRVGETITRKSHARIITATNRDLREALRNGNFRADLYHRLSVFTIRVPPLRELDTDKNILLNHFCDFYAQQAQRPPFQLDQQASMVWQRYPFPGNTRELRNIVIRLTTKYPEQVVSAAQLEAELDLLQGEPSHNEQPLQLEAMQALLHGGFNLDDQLMEYTHRYITAAMDIAHGNISEAAKLLGIARTTLYSRIDAVQKHKMQKT